MTVRQLAEAVRTGDYTQVQAILAKRPELVDLTMSYGDEHRAIHYAVMKRSPEMVRLLMLHGARCPSWNPSAPRCYGTSDSGDGARV